VIDEEVLPEAVARREAAGFEERLDVSEGLHGEVGGMPRERAARVYQSPFRIWWIA
jgi:hypothetical protein